MDGTHHHLVFEPLELLEKLAALTPRPRINLVLYHGILAPHARARARAVAHNPAEPAGVGPSAPAQQPGADPPRPAPEPSVVSTPEVSPDERRTGGTEKPRRWAWADLMRRVFDLDVLACPRCGGRPSAIATIEARHGPRTLPGPPRPPPQPPAP